METNERRSWNLIRKIKEKWKPAKDVNATRVRRRKAVVHLLTRRLPFIKLALFIIGYLWILAIPLPDLGRVTYIDENALQPAQVTTYWDYGNVHTADRCLEHFERLRDTNATSEERAQFIEAEFQKIGLSASTQRYTFSTSRNEIKGTNAYAILSSPRASGNEAMVIAASWISRTGDGDGTLNLRGVSTVLALAHFLKRYSLWAKDIIFVISDGYLDGMQAWLNEYHGSTQHNLRAEKLKYTSGVIWTALTIDYACHSFSHLGIFHEGVNGRLPNQDLINSFERISRFTGGVPVLLYDHLNPTSDSNAPDYLPSWTPNLIRNIPLAQTYAYQATNVLRHVGYQARGHASGVHGLFHLHRIDAFTIFAISATGPHGFHALGRIVESTLRTMNNLLERLHASFFFYILTSPIAFDKIGSYLPSAILISVAMMFHGLKTWVDAGWISNGTFVDEKGSQRIKWSRRKRPVIPALARMLATHLIGAVLFLIISSSEFLRNNKVLSPIIFGLFTILPLGTLVVSSNPLDTAPTSLVLKALNLCLASTVISITTVLNFSLAAFLAVLLGIPLSISAPLRSKYLRVAVYLAYVFLGLGWLLFCQAETSTELWHWEVLAGWFAPFVCIVYVPLVVQAAIITVLPS